VVISNFGLFPKAFKKVEAKVKVVQISAIAVEDKTDAICLVGFYEIAEEPDF
jgi:hypothetical protein